MKHILNAFLVLGLFTSSVAFAEQILTGKPYTKPIDLDINLPKDLNSELPELGDFSQTIMSAQDEQRIGKQILRDVAVSDEVLRDVEIESYVQSLGNRLVKASDSPQQYFHFFVVKDLSINAFAMPGGVIGVHTGLLLASNNESELAGVLGHEIGHVTQHHLARMLAKQRADTFKSIAGLALTLLLARASPQLASGAMTTSSAANIQRQLDYTREHEREADRVGLMVLEKAGFDPRGMPAFFTTLQRSSRFYETNTPSFLRTHPLTSERIADVENRVANMPYKQVPSSLNYYFVRAKLRANQGLPQIAIDQFTQNIKLKRYANEIAEHYGLAVAKLRQNDIAGASNQAQWLDQHGVKSAFVAYLKARIAVASKQPQKAVVQYAVALKQYPESKALIYGNVEHFLALHRPQAAITLIKEKQQFYPEDDHLYTLLAKSYAMAGNDLLSYQAQGEAYYRQYNLHKEVDQMDLAVKAKGGSFYEKSIVEARLKELQRLQKDQDKEN